MMHQLILVDEHDREVGVMEKLEAHQKGLLHRALSVFVFNSNGELLLQRRALSKYHSPGLWTNTACSHPYPGETSLQAATRRLQEEMRLHANLDEAFHFMYRVEFENGLIENEYDYVFVGTTDILPKPDENEVMDYIYWSKKVIEYNLHASPEIFTEWFKLCYEQAFQYYNQTFNRI